jgi:hypothetical protein
MIKIIIQHAIYHILNKSLILSLWFFIQKNALKNQGADEKLLFV